MDFGVVDDVLVNGAVVIQRGSRVMATVTEAQPKGLLGKAGKLNVSLDHARSVLGEKIALRAIKENQGSGSGGDITSIATSLLTAPFMLFMKGKDVTFLKGTEVTAYVHGDVRLNEAHIRAYSANVPSNGGATASKPQAPSATPIGTLPSPAVAEQAPAAAPQPPPAPAPPPGMTNADVVALKTAGFSDDLIVSKIKSSKCAFRLDTKDMIDLKSAGLSDRVIGAMMEKAQ